MPCLAAMALAALASTLTFISACQPKSLKCDCRAIACAAALAAEQYSASPLEGHRSPARSPPAALASGPVRVQVSDKTSDLALGTRAYSKITRGWLSKYPRARLRFAQLRWVSRAIVRPNTLAVN